MSVDRKYADLHIHSKFSRACSRDCDLEHLAWWAGRKGISVVGTGDFTHPVWREELGAKLVPDAPGLFRLRPDLERAVHDTLPPACRTPVRFMLSSEISTIYKRDERTRKVHHLLYAPSLDAVDEITRALARVGNLASDGRPILGLDSRNLLEITLSGGDGCYLVPAHAWTPWFAVLGSQSGFDRVVGLLRGPRGPHLRHRDRPVVRPGDELARLQPRRVPARVQLRRALAAHAWAGGDGVRAAGTRLFPRFIRRCGPATASAAPSSSSRKRASTTSTATAPATSG